MEYFGTNTTDHGHYSWDLSGEYMTKTGLLPRHTPFNPEELTNNLNKGQTVFYQGGGYTAVGISGSCKDDRPGTKSIFWVKDKISKGQMIQLVMQNKHAMKIINSIKFEIHWDLPHTQL